MVKILITRKIPQIGIDIFKCKNYELTINNKSKPLSKSELLMMVKGKDGILCTLQDTIDKEVIDTAGSSLKIISSYSTGYEHIDIQTTKERKIRVGYTGHVLTETSADLTMGLIICIGRRIVEADKFVRELNWEFGWDPNLMLGTEIYNKTLGIIGMGNIGQALARRAIGFNMKIIYNSRSKKTNPKLDKSLAKRISYCSIEELLSESDYVSICCSLNKDSYNLINLEMIKLMKKTSFLINTARGKIVNESDLITALEGKIISGAALDVYDNEPISKTNPLLKMKNVILLPHIASASMETRNKMAKIAAENIVNVLEGRPKDALLVV